MLYIIGKKIIEMTQMLKGIVNLFFGVFYWVVVGPFKSKTAHREDISSQMLFVGVKSVVIVFAVTVFTGMVLAMQMAYLLQKMGSILYVASLVSVSLCRELSPVLTALVVAGKSGSAIAAELGTMKVSEQIEALEVMAINPVRFLAVPRFLALLFMLPCLTVLGDFFGILGGYVVGVGSLGISHDLYLQTSFKYLELKDIYTGIIKAFAFGVIIALVACYEGLNTKGGAKGVGNATTKSVVESFILIILADCVLTAIFYFSNY
ncbi:MAG: ABC transporter permease [Candidatus Omnitrophica bacterium]|nr:ABC transporter permease [Candidatus Omnitrophota bacterium]MDD5081004.1 ABC transporter permease [Candidatus Omnitrophota bacterium]MDD5440943.1 ABC transporter permease [Candidatus Omnitrophota bacterium]